MAEITEFGLERESYTTLLENYKQLFRDEFGSGAVTDDSDFFGQLAAILARLQNDNFNLLEALWASRKLAGAEGIYLDDIFGRLGVYRRGRQAGSGTLILESNSLTPNNFIFPTTTNVTGNNGRTYNAQADTTLVDNVIAYRLTRSDIVLGQQYEMILRDTTNNIQYPFIFTAQEDADRDLMMNSLLSFWLNHTTGNAARTITSCLLYTSPSPRDRTRSRMPSSA